MKLKIALVQNILYPLNIFCTGAKTNSTKVQIELQHMFAPFLHRSLVLAADNFV